MHDTVPTIPLHLIRGLTRDPMLEDRVRDSPRLNNTVRLLKLHTRTDAHGWCDLAHAAPFRVVCRESDFSANGFEGSGSWIPAD